MTRNQNNDESSNKSLKTSDNSGLSTWPNLGEDLLLPIIMKLGPTDFFAFSRVCEYWRSLRRPHINKFMGSSRPMSIIFSAGTCHLEDFDGRVLKKVFPHSTGHTCVGVTCGYMIFFGSETRDFWLVNPFTRHELHFPNVPVSSNVNTNPSSFRGILVFSPFTSQWVFVFSSKFTKTIYYYVSGSQAPWYTIPSLIPILDIHSFMGKIYIITWGNRLFEVGLHPRLSWAPLAIKNFPAQQLLRPEFVNSSKNMYVVSCIAEDVYEAYEMDFEKMECVLIEKPIMEFAFFLSDRKSAAAVYPDTWADCRMGYETPGYLKDTDKTKIKGRCLTADMWYFPHDCYTVNTLQIQ